MTAVPAPLSVLLVDDDDVDIMAVRRVLNAQAAHFSLFVARDGVEALAIIRGEHREIAIPHPYVILLDLNMPRMNGIEFLRALRADPRLGRPLTFVMTTSNASEDQAAAYAAGATGYFIKATIDDDMHALVHLLQTCRNALSR